ncbi:DUF3429 domain-containing protein [Roseomonas sp. CECT 9278]|uniref:DUF3429 domain-containing protein n=1 Tax=Roseomonas sp. CECT 9278 TaxID=2845823 RepID=UPI001E47341D|nr:DUF3429 domain-containing protein [Roseomonas sp. CECT 9278]CAH0217402.1 hypothetical protein ROS9278_02320 [Roseomonas sp. CECT 9278]
MSESTLPRAARLLGLAGLIPTLGLLAIMAALPEWRDLAAAATLGYGAIIASFVGGAWWGLAARADTAAPRLMVLSVLPSLTAWPAVLMPPSSGLLLLAVVFAALLPTDRRLVAERVAPGWWMALRRPLSWGMAALHLAGGVFLSLTGPGHALMP